MSVEKYFEQIYSGVLGKIIGVYLGRPVEGWAYDKIRSEFDEVKYYINERVGVPLIVADDDISGTFCFFRAIEDHGYKKNITAKEIGDTWLNYIIENKTILWWGGLGRSTEHTAFLRLKNGINAPDSGSIKLNGSTLAEQIGAQIFIDAFAMSCPNNPDKAVELAEKAASVSHDGIAVAAACHLAALEAMAFEEKDLDRLLDKAFQYVQNDLLKRIILDVRDICSKETNWRTVRDYLDNKYGYDKFPGCCHMVPNHAMVLASIMLGGDDFQKSVMIASSAAWDTDCNAGNVGAFNGIRLGLAGIDSGADFRTPVSDLMYVVSSDGGSVVSDAVIEAKKICTVAAAMNDENIKLSKKRYTFEFRGSTQGFIPCFDDNGSAQVSNLNETSSENGLLLKFKNIADGTSAGISTPVFIDFSKLAGNFSTIASPTLYSSMLIETTLKTFGDEELFVRNFILYYDIDNQVQKAASEEVLLKKGINSISWVVPETKGMPVFRFGYEFKSVKRFSGTVAILDVDWKGAPKSFAQKGMLMTSIWNTNPFWLRTWVSSAENFAADFKYTYCISHPENNGVATIGTQDWDDYSVTSNLSFSLHDQGGLVIRSKGHRHYYAAVLAGYHTASIIIRTDDKVKTLSSVEFDYQEDHLYKVQFSAVGNRLCLYIDDVLVIETTDAENTYFCGAAGFLVDKGTMLAENFIVTAK